MTDVENRLVVAKKVRLDVVGGRVRRRQAVTHRMDKQQSPIVLHREVYAISLNIYSIYIYIHTHIYMCV